MVWNVRDRFSGDRWRHCQWREISSGQLWHTQNHVRLVKNLPASFTYTIWISLAMPAFLLTFKLKVNDIFGKINLVTVWYRIPTSSFSMKHYWMINSEQFDYEVIKKLFTSDCKREHTRQHAEGWRLSCTACLVNYVKEDRALSKLVREQKSPACPIFICHQDNYRPRNVLIN